MNRAVPYLLLGVSVAAVVAVGSPNVFTALAVALLTAKLVASDRPSPPRTGRRPATAVIITCYNEDPAALRKCLWNLACQTWRPDTVVLVDDCSAQPAAASDAFAHAKGWGLNAVLCRHAVNSGKRQAIATGVRAAPHADVYLTVDSDTFLEAAAVEALASRIDERTQAATGIVLAANRSANLLTRVQDVLYTTAFAVGRAGQSRFGSVLVCSGAISAYHGPTVRRHLNDFVGQTFAGRPVTTGDDRRLTSYALRQGRVVYCPEAVGYTIVPQRLGHFLRQQVRWSRSWFRESYLTMVEQPYRRPQMWLAALDIAIWVTFSLALLLSLVFAWWPALVRLLGAYMLVGLLAMPARCGRYLQVRRDLTVGQRLAGAAVFPAYSALYLLVGLPVRVWAVATMFNGGWGSRQAGVEVHLGA